MLILPLCAKLVLDRFANGVAMTTDRYIAQASLAISILGPLLIFLFHEKTAYILGTGGTICYAAMTTC